MRAVTGSVVSSAPVSLKRASAIISNFVVADTGARPEIAVYSSRASRAFNELLELHREIRSSRGGGVENDELSQHREERHSKRKRKEIEVFDRIEQHGVGINHVPMLDNSAAEMDVKMTKIKERSGVDDEGSSLVGGKKMKERVMTEEGGSSRKEAEGMERNREAELAERGVKHKEEELGEKGTSEERRKKKKKDTKRNGEEDVNVEEGGDKNGKKRKHLDAGNEEGRLGDQREGHQKSGEFGDQSERHHKKKRRKEI